MTEAEDGTPKVVSTREITPVKVCAWKDCSNPAREKSIYCSRNCSNKNARYRHKMRKQAEKEQG